MPTFSVRKILLLFFLVFLSVVSTGRNVRNIPENTLESRAADLLSLKSEDIRNIERVLEASEGERIGPFKNVVMGIYKNYKSTFLGNRTALDYVKSSSRKTAASKDSAVQPGKPTKPKKRKKKKKKKLQSKLPVSYDGTLRYNVGPGVNVSLDMGRDIVNVNLDEDYLKDILTGNWDTEPSQGRRKKNKGNMMTKIMPLFILPFLIQSAVIPFLVAKLKLLLVKSIIVGKLAIFLLVISTLKNSQKSNPYEAAPAYYASDHPSRRSEASIGYRAEGRPTAWVN